MKAVVIKEAGGPEKLVYQDVSMPTLKPGWSDISKNIALKLNQQKFLI